MYILSIGIFPKPLTLYRREYMYICYRFFSTHRTLKDIHGWLKEMQKLFKPIISALFSPRKSWSILYVTDYLRKYVGLLKSIKDWAELGL